MLHLLHHIRRSFFLPGKVRTYLAYAFGEIVLIVVGILIALQISNWNQARIEAKESKVILENLRADLVFQKSAWEENIWWLEQREEATQSVLDLLSSQNAEEDRGKTVEVMLLAGYITEFQPSFPSYEEIKGSGKLSLVKSADLKKRLSEYELKIDLINRVYRTYNGELKAIEKKVMAYLSDTPEAYFPILQPIPDSKKPPPLRLRR